MRSDKPPSFCLSSLWNSCNACLDRKHLKEANVGRQTSACKGPIQTSCIWGESASNVCVCTWEQVCYSSRPLISSEWKWAVNVKFFLKCSTRVLRKPSSSARAGFSWALLTAPLFSVCFHDICMTSPRQSPVILMVRRIIKSARRSSVNINQAEPSLSDLGPLVAYLKPCQRSAGCGMSTSKHAGAVASAGPSDGVNSSLPSLQCNRDQGGSLALTCEGPKPAKNTQRNTTWLSSASLYWTWGR